MLVVLLIASQLIDMSTCNMSPKIVGGDYVTNMTEHPYVAHLKIRCKGKKIVTYFGCGSSIVNQRVLLTAAHCIINCQKQSYILASVGYYIKNKGSLHAGHSYMLHEYYDGSTSYDIALVKLNSSVKFNEVVQRVAIMPHPPYGSKAWIAGWGYTNEQEHISTDRLKHVEQHAWKQNDCLQAMHSIPRGSFCASSNSEEDYPSLGDSGSPLVVKDYIQIGLVSFKKPLLSRNLIVYTDVGYFYEWIAKNSEELYCDEEEDDKT